MTEKNIVEDKITVNARIDPYVVVHDDGRPEVKFNVVLEDTEGDKIVCGYSWLREWLNGVEPQLREYLSQVQIVPVAEAEGESSEKAKED